MNQDNTSNEKTKSVLHYYQKLFLIMAVMAGVFWIGYEKGQDNQQTDQQVFLDKAVIRNRENPSDSVDFSLFWSAWDLLKKKYVDSEQLSAQKLVYGAIKGMMQATGDPYTTFLDPEENKKFSEDISGSFQGIGAELGIKSGILTVIAPIEDTPAEKAGLRAGDKIVKIDGKITADMTVEEAVDLIRGAKGTEVTLTVYHNGSQEAEDIKVVRDTINVKSVKFEMKDDSVAVIKISRFGEDTTKEFNAVMQKISTNRPKGIILDLRNNPGGYLESSIEIASKLLPNGKIVVIEENGDKSQKKMLTRGGDVASGIETVVLINEGSASASEILAGALKDNRSNVTIVGKKSFGKGSVQEFTPLEKGTAAKITIARWLTPNGKQINEEGIHPDIEVEMTNEDFERDADPQMDKALSVLKEKTSN